MNFGGGRSSHNAGIFALKISRIRQSINEDETEGNRLKPLYNTNRLAGLYGGLKPQREKPSGTHTNTTLLYKLRNVQALTKHIIQRIFISTSMETLQ